ncbi:MAG TPA: sigma-54 dependent transcriptional regulator [Myxococcales bacterium]|jgi:two-component system response regulator AtoC|nr:sigma-54 dependent transcriptional regulator [Myxococcales bacterium]
MLRPATVLVVDDEPNIRQNIHFILEKGGMKPLPAASGEEALQLLRTTAVDLVLLDVQMPGMGGMEALRLMRERHPDVGVIMLSVLKEIAVAVEAMHTGALDYVTKDFSPPELIARVRKTLAQQRAGRELERLHDVEATHVARPMISGSAPRMRGVLQVAEKIASKPVTVLITGDSGTGKEVLARYIHARSDRKTGPFVAVNVPGVPAGLLESELFGHERGSFTGADRQKLGKFELANGGTLFLDEIGDLALDLQSKFLRTLQEHDIERVGGEKPIHLDLRVICATNRDLARLVQEGRFREDLYWRLKVVPIELPPLRDRREDIRDLAQHFLARNAAEHGRAPQTLADGALQLLERYRWPGNIRELENIMARMAAICDSQVIEESDLPYDLALEASAEPQEKSEGQSLDAAILAFEKSFLRKALKKNQWNKKATAAQLGMGYSTLKSKLKSYGIGVGGDGDED